MFEDYDALIGFEESGTIRDAMIRHGIRAISCDLKPTRSPGPHYQGDIMDALGAKRWPFAMVHPVCTGLSVSGNHKYAAGKPGHDIRLASIEYVQMLWDRVQKIADRAALENPVGVLSTEGGLGRPQYVQPYQFGDDASKKTGLWLHRFTAACTDGVLPAEDR